MKVVLDTNVLVSGLIFGGTPSLILSAWANGAVSLILSPEILDEYRRVGLELSLPEQVCEDPDDDKFLAAALVGSAPIIVSGDKHLLRVSGWQNVDVIKPQSFVDRYIR